MNRILWWYRSHGCRRRDPLMNERTIEEVFLGRFRYQERGPLEYKLQQHKVCGEVSDWPYWWCPFDPFPWLTSQGRQISRFNPPHLDISLAYNG